MESKGIIMIILILISSETPQRRMNVVKTSAICDTRAQQLVSCL